MSKMPGRACVICPSGRYVAGIWRVHPRLLQYPDTILGFLNVARQSITHEEDSMGYRPLTIICTLAFLGTSLLPAFADSGPIPDTDMPGKDYENFELAQGPETCRETCMKD